MLLSTDGILSGLYLSSAPFLRISAMMVVAPIFSAPGFNLRARVLLVLVVALVAPSITMPASFDLMSTLGLLIAIKEVAVGLMIGFTYSLLRRDCFWCSGHVYDNGVGFCYGGRSQNGVQVPVVAQLYVILGTLLFLAVDGHLAL